MTKKNTAGIVVAIAALALFIGVSIYLKGYDLYLGGVIWKDAGFMWYLIFLMPVLLIHVVSGAKNLKSHSDKEVHRPVYFTVYLIMLLISVVFLVGSIMEGIIGSRTAVIAEAGLNDGRSVLLVEQEEKFTATEGTHNNVTIYCRADLRLKKIGEFSEYDYANNHMIRDNQYRLEQSGDTVTVYYDYGSLTGGMRWRDEAPEYIVKEYNIGK